MAIREISIPVTSEVANAYSHASEEERKVAIRIFADILAPRSKAVADEEFRSSRVRMSQEAEASGLTLEVLEDILADER